MKNMNATLTLASSFTKIENNSFSLNGILDGIIPERDENGYFINNIAIFLNSSIILNNKHDNEENYISENKKYECAIKLTHQNTEKARIISQFDLLIDNSLINKWCKNFYEFKKLISCSKLYLPEGFGDYSVKLLIREKTNNENAPWNVQVIHTLTISATKN